MFVSLRGLIEVVARTDFSTSILFESMRKQKTQAFQRFRSWDKNCGTLKKRDTKVHRAFFAKISMKTMGTQSQSF